MLATRQILRREFSILSGFSNAVFGNKSQTPAARMACKLGSVIDNLDSARLAILPTIEAQQKAREWASYSVYATWEQLRQLNEGYVYAEGQMISVLELLGNASATISQVIEALTNMVAPELQAREKIGAATMILHPDVQVVISRIKQDLSLCHQHPHLFWANQLDLLGKFQDPSDLFSSIVQSNRKALAVIKFLNHHRSHEKTAACLLGLPDLNGVFTSIEKDLKLVKQARDGFKHRDSYLGQLAAISDSPKPGF